MTAATLLSSRRFLPLFVTQALGAFNDNLVKNAMVVIILYHTANTSGSLVALSGGVFILPYVLFSTLAGQLADRFDKSRLIRLTKLFEVGLMAVAAAGFLFDSLPLLFVVLFGLGLQATFFGPMKYGILPDHLKQDELVAGNALIEAGTFAAILIGTIAGGGLIALGSGPLVVAIGGLAVSTLGCVAGWLVPRAPAADPDLRLDWKLFSATVGLVGQAKHSRPVWLSIMGLSWFWAFGSIILAEFPVIARQTLHADAQVVTLLLAGFAIGVGVGSVACGRILHGEISARYVPFAALGLSFFAWDFAHACTVAGSLADVGAVMTSAKGLRLMADLFLLAFCGGMFSVPLYAIIQERSDPAHRSRMIAANNILNALFMVAGAVVIGGLSALGWSGPRIVVLAAGLNLAVALYICRLLPQELIRSLLRWYFTLFHRAEVTGLEHLGEGTRRKVVVINHLSLLDGCFVAAFLPGSPVFVVDTYIAQKWWAKAMLQFVDIFPVDPANPFSAKAMVKAVQAGRMLATFPEGRLTRTGTLMKIYEGAGMVADKSDADLVPVHIEGLEFSRFSGMQGKVRARWFPKLTLSVLAPTRLVVDKKLMGRARRRVTGTALQDLMVDTDFRTRNLDLSLFQAFRQARQRFGGGQIMAEDIERKPLSYDRLLLGALVLGRQFAGLGQAGDNIGVLLPNATATLVTFLGLQAQARVPAMLNFSTGAEGMISSCASAQIRIVISSRRFVERAKLGPAIERLGALVEMVWLEDLQPKIGLIDKLAGYVAAKTGRRMPGDKVAANAPAVVLFTSGSEGTSKGVVLSHRNLVANGAQLASVVDFNAADRVMNAMPMFHSFGLTGGTILPLLYGVRTFFYPSPLHYKIVPELIYETDATIIFGTDTFLTGWGRFAHPYDFYAARYVFSGAEKVRDETRRLYADRFGVRVLEGYGATETAPVIAINTAMHNRPGTVGRLLPAIRHRLEDVPGVTDGGRLFVSGPNVMLGYLKADQPGVLQPPEAGWYDTGDIVAVDSEGYLTIKGRAKRFAKIAGEMVSMAAAETLAAKLWPDAAHAVVALPDPRKGEALVLVTTQIGAEVRALLAKAREAGTSELMVPRMIKTVDKLPLLGTGKTDYPAVQKLVAGATLETAEAES